MSKEFAKLYKEQRDQLRKSFIEQRTGEQTRFEHQAELFKPLIETQEKESKAIQEKIVTDHKELENALVPFTNELKRRNEQVEEMKQFPLYTEEIKPIDQSTPEKKPINIYNPDRLLDLTDTENLENTSLDLPSKVIEYGNIEEVLSEIKTKNRVYGQLTGKASKHDPKAQEMYRSYKNTLSKYKQSLLDLKPIHKYQVKKGEGNKSKFVKQKRGRGRPRKYPKETIIYNNENDLFTKLHEFVTAKQAGNTGLDNTINAILDELLEKNFIKEDEYDRYFNFIFS